MEDGRQLICQDHFILSVDRPAKSPDDHTRPSQGDVEAAVLKIQGVEA
jgi:hypothetical protein